jgi:site-specific recombinase XerD
MTSKNPEPDVAPETLAVADAPAQETNPTPKPKATKARKPKTDLTLADLCERYIKHLEEDDGKSPGTCSSYAAELKLAIKHLGGDTPIASITTEQVAEFFGSKPVVKLRSGKAKSQLSIDKTRRVLRLALVWAAERKWLASAPIPEATQS